MQRLVGNWHESYRAKPAFSSRDKSMGTKVHAWKIDKQDGDHNPRRLKKLMLSKIAQLHGGIGSGTVLIGWVDEEVGQCIVATMGEPVKDYLDSIQRAMYEAGAN